MLNLRKATLVLSASPLFHLRASLQLVHMLQQPSRIFCSQLVAEAYERAGAKLVNEKEARQITPRLLYEGSALRPVKPIPIRKPISRNAPPLDRDAQYAKTA